MAAAEQFVYTDRKRGEGVDPNIDGGFQIAAFSSGVTPPQLARLATMADELGHLFATAVAMTSNGAPPAIGTATRPVWCWTPVEGDTWALARSVYLGRSASSARPQGNYLFHAMLMRPDDLAGLGHNPVALATALAKQEAFWSEDKGLRQLQPIPLTPRTVDWAKMRAQLPAGLARGDTLALALSLMMDLHDHPDRCLMLNNMDSGQVWHIMGYLLSLLPSFIRGRISASNLCLARFVKAPTMRQSLTALASDISIAGANRISNLIGEIDMPTGQLAAVQPGYTPRALARWTANHVDTTAQRFHRYAESAGLAGMGDYESLVALVDLFDGQAIRVRPPGPNPAATSPSAATEPREPDELERLSGSLDPTGARADWVRGILCDLLETRFGQQDHHAVSALLRYLQRHPAAAPLAAASPGPADGFLDRLDSTILNTLRVGNWSMVLALLEGIQPSHRAGALLDALSQAGPSIRPPPGDVPAQVKTFCHVIRSISAHLVRRPPADQFNIVTDLLFRMFETLNASYDEAIICCMGHCARLIRAQLSGAGDTTLDEHRLGALCASPGLDRVPELALACARLEVRHLIRTQFGADGDLASSRALRAETGQTIRELANLVSRGLIGCANAPAELGDILDHEVDQLPEVPPLRCLMLGMLWPQVPEQCRPEVFARFSGQSVLGGKKPAPPLADSRDANAMPAPPAEVATPSPGGVAVVPGGIWRSEWLIDELATHGRPEAFVKWAIEQGDLTGRRDLTDWFVHGSDTKRVTMLKAVLGVLPADPAQHAAYRDLILALANDPGAFSYGPQTQAHLLRTTMLFLRPGDKQPLLFTGTRPEAVLGATDQKYLKVLGIIDEAEAKSPAQAFCQCFWMDLWMELQASQILADTSTLKEWNLSPRGPALANWVLQRLQSHPLSNPVEMDIIAHLLRTLGGLTDRNWAEALRLAFRGLSGAWVDQLGLVIWSCRRYADRANSESELAGQLNLILTQIDADTLQRIAALGQTPVMGLSTQVVEGLTRCSTLILEQRRRPAVEPLAAEESSKPQKRRLFGWIPLLGGRSGQAAEPVASEADANEPPAQGQTGGRPTR